MPKKLEGGEAKPFQPIKSSFLKSVLDEDPPARDEEGSIATATEPASEPEVRTPARAAERKLVQMPQGTAYMGRAENDLSGRRSRVAPVPATGERLNWPLKVQLQPSERIELTRIVNELSSTLGTSLTVSHVTRALLTVFGHAEGELQKRARQSGPLKRPPNDDLTAIAVFEHELAKLLLGALREAKPLRQ